MKQATLLYASTEPGTAGFSADLLWRTHFRAPDPIFYIELDQRRILLASSLEYGRAKAETKNIEVMLIDDLTEGAEHRTMLDGLRLLLASEGVDGLIVPGTLPYSLGTALAKHFTIEVVRGSIFPERSRKSTWEVNEITKAGEAVAKAIEDARVILADATISGDTILYREHPLTSEKFRSIIERSLFDQGYLGIHTIVAGGVQAAQPHELGSGPLRPYQPIVCDIFPYSIASHYYADITRTLFKGKPAPAMERMYEAVRVAQEARIKDVKAGIDAHTLQEATEKEFEAAGFPTVTSKGVTEGFIHSLGHGLGLEMHEAPHVGGVSAILQAGEVITIEPGLYYPEEKGGILAGGIRIEDMVLVEENGQKLLSPIPKGLDWAVIP